MVMVNPPRYRNRRILRVIRHPFDLNIGRNCFFPWYVYIVSPEKRTNDDDQIKTNCIAWVRNKHIYFLKYAPQCTCNSYYSPPLTLKLKNIVSLATAHMIKIIILNFTNVSQVGNIRKLVQNPKKSSENREPTLSTKWHIMFCEIVAVKSFGQKRLTPIRLLWQENHCRDAT